jgi:hypothetical protein
MTTARVIEVGDLTAGILVPDIPGRFRFFSSHRAFDRLEGRSFRSLAQASLAARGLLARRDAPAADCTSRETSVGDLVLAAPGGLLTV